MMWKRFRALLLVEASANARCSLDFIHGQMAHSRRFRFLNIVYDVTHECLAVIPDTPISGRRVARELTAFIEQRGRPSMIVSDNGAEFYPSRPPLTAVHTMNHDVIPNFEEHGARIEVVLSDDGRQFCGRPDQHPYELFLQLEDIEHRTTRLKRPQSNGIAERLHRTLLDEHFRVEGRRTWFETIDEMQKVPDDYLVSYNAARPHQGRGMNGRIPFTAFKAGLQKPTQKKKEKSPPQKRGNQLAA